MLASHSPLGTFRPQDSLCRTLTKNSVLLLNATTFRTSARSARPRWDRPVVASPRRPLFEFISRRLGRDKPRNCESRHRLLALPPAAPYRSAAYPHALRSRSMDQLIEGYRRF